MSEAERFFAIAVVVAALAGAIGGYSYARRGLADAARRTDSLRVEVARLDEVTRAQDLLLAGESAHAAHTTDSLQVALRAALARASVQVVTLTTFALPPGAQAALDSLTVGLQAAQAASESLTVAHTAQVALFEQHLSAKDSALAVYRRLAEAALRQPAPRPSRTLRTLALGALAGAVLWETIR